MWAQNLLPSLLQTFLCPKFACDHAPLIRFVIRPAGPGAITPAQQWCFITLIRSISGDKYVICLNFEHAASGFYQNTPEG